MYNRPVPEVVRLCKQSPDDYTTGPSVYDEYVKDGRKHFEDYVFFMQSSALQEIENYDPLKTYRGKCTHGSDHIEYWSELKVPIQAWLDSTIKEIIDHE